jgi:CMP-N-acetylneuraminic acid synthetase/spore coat polysaccharide biosynthesis predicted glycosyltransferase SpsG
MIVAIIPARAGSKGIPNKNIRIIGGHPLVYYAIKNAIDSTYITDIIVTTDSPEVQIIARQMGVNVHWRSEELCGDEVTLDAVIADAVPQNQEWEYVITMQPTSPTLQSSTLDHAIQYTIEHDLDTVISAINAPHLSWVEKDGKKIPHYKERLNRQFLPPYYMETGAFMISRASVITCNTRIGQKVDIFEVPDDESQDVDTFEDLKSVAATLERPQTAIYVNGNNSRGTGHIYRALELADEFYVKPDIYYDINQTDPAVFGKTTHRIIPVNGIVDLFHQCREKKYTIFINDILSTSLDYMIGLRSVLPDAKIVNFEDDGEGIIKADLVFNALYKEKEFPQVYAGEKYYIAGKTFLFYKPITIREQVKRVFVSFGGADPQNYSDRILNMIVHPEFQEYEFVMVLGRAKENVDALLEFNKYPNIRVLYDVPDMPEIMASCDIGITSRGRTGYELAILGIPTLAMAQNTREEKHGFVCNENGFTYLGLNPPDEVIKSNLKMYVSLSQESRKHFQEMLLSHNLRDGRKRVMNLIHGL